MKVGRFRVVVVVGLGLFAPDTGGALAENAALTTCGRAGIGWTRRLISSGPITLGGMAPTADGGLVVAGSHTGDVRVDAPGAPAQTQRAASTAIGGFLMQLAADGSVRWLRKISGVDGVSSVAVRPDGTIVVGGASEIAHKAAMEGPPDLVFPGETRSLRLLVGVYGDDGTPRAAWTIGTVSAGKERFGSATLTELAADRNRIAFAGMVFGVVELGTGARRRVLTTVGATDIYFGALENDGARGWAIRGGGTGSDTPGPIALGRDGSVSISGRTSNDGQGPAFGTPDPVTFGEASAPALHRTGGLDALVGQIDRRGHLVWASTVGGDEPWGLKAHSKYGAVVPSFEESIAGTLALPNGETLFIGNAALPTLFQGKTILLAPPGASAGSFVGRVSAAGRLLAAATLGLEHVDAVAAAPGGDLIVAGEIEGVATYPATGLKQTTMTSAGREDVFVARQAPDGTLRWGIRLGGRGHDRAERVTIDAGGAVTIAARFDEGFAIGDQVCGAPPPHEFPAGTVDLIRFAPGGPHPDDARESRLAAERAKISALQGEASRAFKDKRYAQACAAYQNVAASRPDSGAALADVGLCLQRRGKKKEAIAADQKAVALAAKTDLSDDGDPSTRKHAYFNLYKLGVRVALPKTGCRKLPAA